MSRAAFDEGARDALDALTRAITNKILHAPLSRLRQEAEREEGMAYLEVARVLFDLDSADSESADSDGAHVPGDADSAVTDDPDVE